MQKINTYVNKSTHKRLLEGHRYTLKELALISGVPHSTLHGRMHYKESFTDIEIRPSERAIIWPLLETESAKLSAKWLNRRLVNV